MTAAPESTAGRPGRWEQVLGTAADGRSVIEVHQDDAVTFEYRLGAAVLASAASLHALVDALRTTVATNPG